MFLKVLWGLIISMSVFGCNAEEWAISKGKLSYNGTEINSSFKIKEKEVGTEGGYLFNYKSNAQDTLRVLKILSPKGENEVWLYNVIDKSVEKLDLLPVELSFDWVSNFDIVASRSSMGASVSVIYQTSIKDALIRKSGYIKNLVYFEPSSSLLVRIEQVMDSNSQINVLYSTDMGATESFKQVQMKFDYHTDVLGAIKKVDIKDCRIVLNYVYNKQSWSTSTEKIESLCI